MAEEIKVTEEWIAEQCDRICAKAAAVPLGKRREFMQKELASLRVTHVLRIALENMILARENVVTETSDNRISLLEKLLGFGFGVAFVIVILVIAIKFSNPTPFQLYVFRVVLSLAAAGVGGILSGFLKIMFGNASKPWLQAGGALAIFALVYLVNPAQLVMSK